MWWASSNQLKLWPEQRLGMSIPWARKMSACRLPFGEGSGNSPQYSCLENPMDRGGWQTTVHGVSRAGHDLVTKPPTRLYLDSNYNSFLNLQSHRLQHHILALLSLHNCMSQFPKISLSLSLSVHPPMHILSLVFSCPIVHTSLKNCNQNSAKLKEQVLRLIKFLYFIQGGKGNILASSHI